MTGTMTAAAGAIRLSMLTYPKRLVFPNVLYWGLLSPTA